MNGNPVTIFVDADATPRDALASVDELAAETGCSVVTISTVNHEFHREGHISVDPHPQAVDMEIIRRLPTGSPSVVVTQDYGLAALALGKGARAVSPRGIIYSEANIDLLLFERDLNARARRASGRVRGPSARTKEDARKFRDALRQVLEEIHTEMDASE